MLFVSGATRLCGACRFWGLHSSPQTRVAWGAAGDEGVDGRCVICPMALPKIV